MSEREQMLHEVRSKVLELEASVECLLRAVTRRNDSRYTRELIKLLARRADAERKLSALEGAGPDMAPEALREAWSAATILADACWYFGQRLAMDVPPRLSTLVARQPTAGVS